LERGCDREVEDFEKEEQIAEGLEVAKVPNDLKESEVVYQQKQNRKRQDKRRRQAGARERAV